MTWRHVRLHETEPGRYALVTAFLGNPIGRLLLDAAYIDKAVDPHDMTLQQGTDLADRIDKWITDQGKKGTKSERTE
jgi:hypothetical protein